MKPSSTPQPQEHPGMTPIVQTVLRALRTSEMSAEEIGSIMDTFSQEETIAYAMAMQAFHRKVSAVIATLSEDGETPLSDEEEQVFRMSHGVGVTPRTPLQFRKSPAVVPGTGGMSLEEFEAGLAEIAEDSDAAHALAQATAAQVAGELTS